MYIGTIRPRSRAIALENAKKTKIGTNWPKIVIFCIKMKDFG